MKIALLIAMFAIITPALAERPYPTPTRHGRERPPPLSGRGQKEVHRIQQRPYSGDAEQVERGLESKGGA